MHTDSMRKFIISFLFYLIVFMGAFFTIKYVLPFILPFIWAFIIALLLKPLTNKLTKSTGKKRKLVAGLLLIVFYAILISLLVVLGTRIAIATKELFLVFPTFYKNNIEPIFFKTQNSILDIASNLSPDMQNVFDNASNSIVKNINSIVENISVQFVSFAGKIASGIPSFFAMLFITIIASFFFVTDYYTITSFIARQLPPKINKLIFAFKTQVIKVVFKFAKAYAILISITFVELSTGFLLLKIDNAIILAFIIAFVDIFPILGVGTVLIPWSLFSFIDGNFTLAFGILILHLIISSVRQILEPKIIGAQIGLHPIAILFTMFIGAKLFGIMGLFGLPILLTIIMQLNKSGKINILK